MGRAPSDGTPELFSVVLPVQNQADHIEHIVRGYSDALDAVKGVAAHELLLVPNASADATLEVCSGLAASDERIRLVAVEQPGWGRAVKAGLHEAHGDLLCFTNAARTTPEMLVLMASYALAYPGVVVKASRRTRDSWRRRLGSLLYNIESRVLFDLATWDINGTPKVFPRTLTALLDLRSDDDLYDLEFVATCRHKGYPLVDVPILATTRHGGRSTTNYASAVRLYLGAVKLHRAWNEE